MRVGIGWTCVLKGRQKAPRSAWDDGMTPIMYSKFKPSGASCRRYTAELLDKIYQLRKIHFAPLRTLGKTLHNWREEVARMFRFTRNNGITEGFHRKMKLIQRRAYGFRNFENYRLRVRVLCCWKWLRNWSETCRKICPSKGLAPVFGALDMCLNCQSKLQCEIISSLLNRRHFSGDIPSW